MGPYRNRCSLLFFWTKPPRHHRPINQYLAGRKFFLRIPYVLLHQQLLLRRHIHRKRSPRRSQSHKTMLFAHRPGIITRRNSIHATTSHDCFGARRTSLRSDRNRSPVGSQSSSKRKRRLAARGTPRSNLTLLRSNTDSPSAPSLPNARSRPEHRSGLPLDTCPSGRPWSMSSRRSI